MSPPQAEIIVQNELGNPIDESEIRRHLESILRRLGCPVNLNIELIFVGDKRIKQLNRQFRQIDEPTDVLSFPADRTALASRRLGSIVISLETASRQAQKGGLTLAAELKTLSAHGLLHLLGYHHAEHADFAPSNARHNHS
jgi:probable rRNA maturation factor